MSRILLWSPNYAPELTGIPPLVTDAAEWLANRGHHIDVVTAFPNYPERKIHSPYRRRVWVTELRGPVKVHRSWLRVRPRERFTDKALYELSFSAFSLPQATWRSRNCDALVCVVPCLTAALAARGIAKMMDTRLIVWIQDLVLRAALSLDGLGSGAQNLLKLAHRVERAAIASADHVVACSPAFASYLRSLGIPASKIETIYNWVDLERISASPARGTPSRVRFLYTGNLGYTQGFETLIRAAAVVEGAEVQIVGAGNAAEQVSRLAERVRQVEVCPPVPERNYPAVLASADVQVVIQRKVSSDVNFPSKIAPYLASGRAIVASIDQSSAAASVLRDSGAALLVDPEDSLALAHAMRRLVDDAQLRVILGDRARKYAESHFDRRVALERFEAVVTGCC
jgi:colanic acid biosynthesis glycosyl transferase WcaI